MIRKHTRRAAKAAFAISFGVAIILGGATAAARKAPPRRTPIIVGTKNFGEAFVLGQLYKQALEAKGFKVSLQGEHRLHRAHPEGAHERAASRSIPNTSGSRSR